MKRIAHTSRVLAEKYLKKWPEKVVIEPDRAGMYFVYLKKSDALDHVYSD